MKSEFVETANTIRFDKICNELENPMSLIGASMAVVTGAAGRGKTEAAKRHAINSDAIYIPPMAGRSGPEILREISFELAKVRPNRAEACRMLIADEMGKQRRLLIIDEADLLKMEVLEILRNINERYACPIMLIGEDTLKGKLVSRPRLDDRVRRRMEFTPPSLQDIAFYFKRNFSLALSKDVCAVIHRHSKGTFRRVVRFAVYVDQAMQASSVDEISVDLAQMVIGEIEKDKKDK